MSEPARSSRTPRFCSQCGFPAQGPFCGRCGHRHQALPEVDAETVREVPLPSGTPTWPVGHLDPVMPEPSPLIPAPAGTDGESTPPMLAYGEDSTVVRRHSELPPPSEDQTTVADVRRFRSVPAAGEAGQYWSTRPESLQQWADLPVRVPVTINPAPPPQPGAKPRWVIWLVACGLAIVLLGTGGYILWDRFRPEDPPPPQTATGPTAVAPAPPAPTVTIRAATPTNPPTTDAAPTPDSNEEALEELAAWRAESLADTPLDGRWVLQLASKYPGVIDESQVAENGGSTFLAADIRSQFRDLESDMTDRGIPVIHLLDSDFGTNHSERSGTIWTLLADPGGLADRNAAEQACKDLFPELSGDNLRNSCLPRRLLEP